MKKTLLSLIATVAATVALSAQTVSVKDTVMTTYPYSDPNPVPTMSKSFPYWHFQQYSTKPVQKVWKMVVLENEYLRVKVFPEIGGKVWSIFDKSGGRELVYDNDVVKFRDIALRGPWTSGGIEFNYGVIGHAPSCSSPVDWRVEKKADGSVSCYVGVLEMLSHSRWTIEINLPKDAVWCTTRSIWHNLSGEWQPYYSWANSAVETSDDLVLVYPARNAIGHNGEPIAFPLNEKGEDISKLCNQAYGADKSYHMVGSHKSFFGAYYPSADWGSLHWSLRDEKLGRKYYTWAQSEQGTIWIDLLTDGRKQYVELQSGRLFNQNYELSAIRSGYRQFLFSPYGTDEWCEYWLPYAGIGAADNVTLDSVTSVAGNRLSIYPLRPYAGPVRITDAGGKVLYEEQVSLKPACTWSAEVDGVPAEAKLGRRVIWQADPQQTDRPQSRSDVFDPESSESLTLLARDNFGLRNFKKSENLVDKALAKSPSSTEALALKAALLYHRMMYADAYEVAGKALSIDQYNAEAGYVSGLAAARLGKIYDAMDRFEVAAISDGPMRSACYTELARLHFKAGDNELAEGYAKKALKCNSQNVTAMMILCKASGCGTDAIRALDPLCHFPSAEDFLSGKISAADFAGEFQSEIPWEDYLELAIFYHSLDLNKEAAAVLGALPSQNALTALWKAYLEGDQAGVAAAEASGVDLVVPYRAESARPLEWAAARGGWQSAYLLSVLKYSFGYNSEALAALKDFNPDYAPFHAYKYGLTKETSDLRRAQALEPDSWRYRKMLATDRIAKGDCAEAVTLLAKWYRSHPENFQVGDALIDAYMGLGRYRDAEKIVDKIVYLPFEGQKDSRSKYRDIKLHIAAEECDRGNYAKALSKVDEALLWPARLGAGKPFDNLVNTSKEDWVRSEIEKRQKGLTKEPLAPQMVDSAKKDKKLF